MFNQTFFFKNLSPVFEDNIYNYNLNFLSKFNSNILRKNNFCSKIVLNFGFKTIKFDKKKMILFFLILELLSNQKCIVTHSRKNIITFKIKRGSVVGCKVTLRNENIGMLLDIFLLGLPRSEIFKGISLKKIQQFQDNLSTQLNEFFIFYPLETEITAAIDKLDITFKFISANFLEKMFFFSHNKIPLNVY